MQYRPRKSGEGDSRGRAWMPISPASAEPADEGEILGPCVAVPYRPSTRSEKEKRQYGSSTPAAAPPRQPRSAEASSDAAPPPRPSPSPALTARSVGNSAEFDQRKG